MRKIAFGACSTALGTIDFMMLIVAPARSSRDCPGFCLAPAVMTTTSASLMTSMSAEPSTVETGANWTPWAMSSASALTLDSAMSNIA
jgi:hypothetical protein